MDNLRIQWQYSCFTACSKKLESLVFLGLLLRQIFRLCAIIQYLEQPSVLSSSHLTRNLAIHTSMKKVVKHTSTCTKTPSRNNSKSTLKLVSVSKMFNRESELRSSTTSLTMNSRRLKMMLSSRLWLAQKTRDAYRTKTYLSSQELRMQRLLNVGASDTTTSRRGTT